MIITYAGPAGRQVVMADTNPGIGGLGAATALTLEDYRALPRRGTPEPERRAGPRRTAPGAALAPPPGPGRPQPRAAARTPGLA